MTSHPLTHRTMRLAAVCTGTLVAAAIALTASPAHAEIASGSERDPKDDLRVEHPGYDEHHPTSDLRKTTVTVRRNFVDIEFTFEKHVRGTVNGFYADVYPDSADDDTLFLAQSPTHAAGLYRVARNRTDELLCGADVVTQFGERGTLTVTADRDCFTPAHAGDGRVRELTVRRIAVEGYDDFKLKWRDYSTSVKALESIV